MDRRALFQFNIEKVEHVYEQSKHLYHGKQPIIVLADLSDTKALLFSRLFADHATIERLLESHGNDEVTPTVIFPVDADRAFLDLLIRTYPDCSHVISESNRPSHIPVLVLGDEGASAVFFPIP